MPGHTLRESTVRIISTAIVVVLVLAAGSWALQVRYRQDRVDDAMASLESDARFIGVSLERWVEQADRFAAAQGIQGSLVQRLDIVLSGDEVVRTGVTDRLETARIAADYAWVRILDRTGETVIFTGEEEARTRDISSLVDRAFGSHEIIKSWPTGTSVAADEGIDEYVAAIAVRGSDPDREARAVLAFGAKPLPVFSEAIERVDSQGTRTQACIQIPGGAELVTCDLGGIDDPSVLTAEYPVPGTPFMVETFASRADVLAPANQLLVMNVLLVCAMGLAAGAGRVAYENALRQRDVEADARGRIAEALATEERFLASMSHEFRTPLNSIIGFSSILVSGGAGPLNEEQQKQMAIVRKSGTRMLGLVNNVLDFSQIRAGQLSVSRQEFDVAVAAEDARRLMEPIAIGKGLLCECLVRSDDGVLQTDRQLLERVLINLLDNAVKYTDAGSVTLSAFVEGDEAVFEVADTGSGIPHEAQERLTEPYFRAGRDRAITGSGLGLTISAEIARALGGRLDVTSTPGEGSTFTLRIPRVLPDIKPDQ
ncbi:MAG: HAMP domain-containing sensor histidine kinase [Coriobacteriia bacterium]|nr:HAMP domain-containing sensor histidine kinase [Coriobacteriia bacterium]